MADDVLTFGPFELRTRRRALSESGKYVRVGSRAMDVLIALTERPGEIIGNDELVCRAWPRTVVERGGLRVQIAGLRKVLRDGRAGRRYIVNVPGRGYSFVATVAHVRDTPATPAPVLAGTMHRLPLLATRLIGRSEVCDNLMAKLATRRFVTIVGPGGIGKTTVALALAARLVQKFSHGVVFIDLAPLAGPTLVAATIASAVGISLPAEDPVGRLIAFLREKQILLVIDNCEHLIREAAATAELLIRAGSRISVLATSREPLRAEGEWVERLLPLAMPSTTAVLSAAAAIAFPAIELFAERAAASSSAFALSDAGVATAINICRQLDGIPLAIELAAASIESFGLAGLASRLDDRFALLTRGRRTALQRQQTLRATFDWSYGILSPVEQTILRRLAIFSGWFTDHSACGLAADEIVRAPAVLETLASLVAKSLVVAEAFGEAVHYRLLDTTRVYARARMSGTGERTWLNRRHAVHFCMMFEAFEAEWGGRPTAGALAAYTRAIFDVRTALRWSFSTDGDATIGFRLTAASSTLWFHLSLMDEYRAQVKSALEILQSSAVMDSSIEMGLLIALGHATYHCLGPGPEMVHPFARGLVLAEEMGSGVHQLHAVWGLWIVRSTSSDYHGTLALAKKHAELASQYGDRDIVLFADRILARSYHWLGEHELAWHHTKSSLAYPDDADRRPPGNGYQLSHRAAIRPILARIQWMRGYPDQALATVEEIANDVLVVDHPPSACYILAVGACPVAIWAGEFSLARRLTAALLQASTEYDLKYWQVFGRCYEFALSSERLSGRKIAAALAALLEEMRPGPRHLEMLATLLPGFLTEAFHTRLAPDQQSWNYPEHLRAKGELILAREGLAAAATAEACFQQATAAAAGQNALSWELRSVTSLARLWRDSGRVSDARDRLENVYGRFTEGLSTADLAEARALLSRLGSAVR